MDELTRDGEEDIERERYFLSMLNTEEMERYRAAKSVRIPKAIVEEIYEELFEAQISKRVAIIINGIAKIYAAELIEVAKQIQLHQSLKEYGGNEEEITQDQLREAWRQTQLEGILELYKIKPLLRKQ